VVGSLVVGASVVGSLVVGASVVGSLVVGASVVGAAVVGAAVVGAATVVSGQLSQSTGQPSLTAWMKQNPSSPAQFTSSGSPLQVGTDGVVAAVVTHASHIAGHMPRTVAPANPLVHRSTVSSSQKSAGSSTPPHDGGGTVVVVVVIVVVFLHVLQRAGQPDRSCRPVTSFLEQRPESNRSHSLGSVSPLHNVDGSGQVSQSTGHSLGTL